MHRFIPRISLNVVAVKNVHNGASEAIKPGTRSADGRTVRPATNALVSIYEKKVHCCC